MSTENINFITTVIYRLGKFINSCKEIYNEYTEETEWNEMTVEEFFWDIDDEMPIRPIPTYPIPSWLDE